MGDDNSLKNRVQPANSPQAKCFVSRAMMGSELVAVPDFSLLHRFLPRAARRPGASPIRPATPARRRYSRRAATPLPRRRPSPSFRSCRNGW